MKSLVRTSGWPDAVPTRPPASFSAQDRDLQGQDAVEEVAVAADESAQRLERGVDAFEHRALLERGERDDGLGHPGGRLDDRLVRVVDVARVDVAELRDQGGVVLSGYRCRFGRLPGRRL